MRCDQNEQSTCKGRLDGEFWAKKQQFYFKVKSKESIINQPEDKFLIQKGGSFPSFDALKRTFGCAWREGGRLRPLVATPADLWDRSMQFFQF